MCLAQCPALATSSAQWSILPGILARLLAADLGEFQVMELIHLPSFLPAKGASLPAPGAPIPPSEPADDGTAAGVV